jgi:hypothetical protein
MSASGFIDAAGIVGDLLGLIGFIQDNLPMAPPDMGASVRVKLGLSKGDSEEQMVSQHFGISAASRPKRF